MRDAFRSLVRNWVPYIEPNLAAKYHVRLSRLYLLSGLSLCSFLGYCLWSSRNVDDVTGVQEITSAAELDRHLNSSLRNLRLSKVRLSMSGVEPADSRRTDYERLLKAQEERAKIIERLQKSE